MFKTKIINLARRTDRWEQVVPEVQRFGIIEFERFDAIEGGYMGFNKSVHFALEGEGELLLLEDDVYFTGTLQDLLAAKESLPDNWDLLYLGANLKSKVPEYNDKVYRCKDAWTSHAILYSAKAAQYCFEHFDPEQGTIYDEWLRSHAQLNLHCFVMAPMIAFQRDGFSDIWGANTVYGIAGSQVHFHK